MKPKYSIVVPVYRNEAGLPDLLSALSDLFGKLESRLEVVFVVDGSPDASFEVLRRRLPERPFPSKLVLLSRNFGSFSAVRRGLEDAEGEFFAVMAADLQEPPEVAEKILKTLAAEPVDVVVAQREGRDDPFLAKTFSSVFWFFYRWWVEPNLPKGGVDCFGCNRKFRDELLKLQESHSSLIGLIYWLGFRRKEVSYRRVARKHGVSAWTFRRKFRYLMDSVFSFTDLPIRVLIAGGIFGQVIAFVLGLAVFFAKVSGAVPVPGYAATVITITFFAALNSFGLGIIGSYVWRAFENTKSRPLNVVTEAMSFGRENS